MHRLIGDNHSLSGLSFSAQVFLRALDGIRRGLAADANVTIIELSALGRIAEEVNLPQESLAAYLDLSDDVVDKLVVGLVERDFVTRVGQSDDAASKTGPLELTPAGHAVMEKVYGDFQATIDEAADTLKIFYIGFVRSTTDIRSSRLGREDKPFGFSTSPEVTSTWPRFSSKVRVCTCFLREMAHG
jgi:DNA-binding MarR family transcriptional regulator